MPHPLCVPILSTGLQLANCRAHAGMDAHRVCVHAPEASQGEPGEVRELPQALRLPQGAEPAPCQVQECAAARQQLHPGEARGADLRDVAALMSPTAQPAAQQIACTQHNLLSMLQGRGQGTTLRLQNFFEKKLMAASSGSIHRPCMAVSW